MSAGVYLVTHRPTGLRYVGASKDVERRIRNHLRPSLEHWKQYLPEEYNTPTEELQVQILERVEQADLDTAERDWWFLLRPETNVDRIPTMRGFSGRRLTKKRSCDEMRSFLTTAREQGITSNRTYSLYGPKADLWEAVIDVMAQQARARRGHLLEALSCE